MLAGRLCSSGANTKCLGTVATARKNGIPCTARRGTDKLLWCCRGRYAMIRTTLIECWPHPSVGACGASCRAVPGSRFVTTSAYLYYGAETVACAGPGLPSARSRARARPPPRTQRRRARVRPAAASLPKAASARRSAVPYRTASRTPYLLLELRRARTQPTRPPGPRARTQVAGRPRRPTTVSVTDRECGHHAAWHTTQRTPAHTNAN